MFCFHICSLLVHVANGALENCRSQPMTQDAQMYTIPPQQVLSQQAGSSDSQQRVVVGLVFTTTVRFVAQQVQRVKLVFF